jgi:hypothetical protein
MILPGIFHFSSIVITSSVKNSQCKRTVINKEAKNVQNTAIFPTQKPKCHCLALPDWLYFKENRSSIYQLCLKGSRSILLHKKKEVMTEELIDTSHKTSSMTDCITATCQ